MYHPAAGHAGRGLFHRQAHRKAVCDPAGCLLLFGGMELLCRGNDPAGEVTAGMFFGWLGLLGAIGSVVAMISRGIKLRWLKKQEAQAQEEQLRL